MAVLVVDAIRMRPVTKLAFDGGNANYFGGCRASFYAELPASGTLRFLDPILALFRVPTNQHFKRQN
ncbi:MAG: hypothetical protein ACKO96_47445 [Flammeovirgaceae bacterium]